MRKFLKILGYIIGGILLLLILLFVIIQTPWGENIVRKQATDYLAQKLKTTISIGKISYKLPNHIQLSDVFIADKGQDTLLFLHDLALDWKAQDILLRKQITVTDLTINGLNANIYRREKDTSFNYQFIIDAFVSAPTGEKDQVAKDTTGTGFGFDVHKISLNHIRFRYDDTAGGVLFAAALGKAFLRPTLVDLNKSRYALNELEVSDIDSRFISDSSHLPPEPPDTSAPGAFRIAVKNIVLNNARFVMLSRPDSMYLHSFVGRFQGELKDFDLLKEWIETGNLSLENAETILKLGKENTAAAAPEVAETDTTENQWKIFAGGLALNQIRFVFDDPNAPRQKNGLDYSHMDFNQLFLTADKAYYSSDSSAADIKHLALREQCGLDIMDLRSQASYTSQGAILKDFYLQTPNSLLQNYLSVQYPSLDALSKNMNKMLLSVNLKDSRVGVNDLLLFLPPGQQDQLLPYKNQQFKLIAQVKGYLDKIKLNRFYLSGLNGTTIDLKGILNNATDPDKLSYNLQLAQVHSTAKDISPFLPDSIKQQYDLPEWMDITGNISGTLQNYFPSVSIKTADGNANVDGKFLMAKGIANAEYDLAVRTNDLDLGKILKQDSVIGKITSSLNAAGTGFNPKQMSGNARMHLQSAWLMGYNYQDIDLSADVRDQQAVFESHSRDSNLNFDLSGSAGFQNEYPALTLEMKMRRADLQALKLYDSTLSLSGNIKADFASLNPDYPAGTLSWTNPFINYQDKKLHPDSIYLKSSPGADSMQNIDLNLAGVLHAYATGHLPLTKIGDAFAAHLNRHYHLADSLDQTQWQHYDFALNGHLKYQRILQQLLPELSPFDTIPIQLSLSPDTMSVNMAFRKLEYAGNILDSGIVAIQENPKRLQYKVSLKNAQTGAMALWYPYVSGIVRNDSIYAVVNIDDSLKEKQFTLGGAYSHDHHDQSGKSFFKLFKGIRFNYDIWKIDPDNQVVFDSNGFYISGLNMTYKDQSIAVNSASQQANAPLNVKISNFSLANITSVFSKDTLLADGILNATADISFLDDGAPQVNARLDIKDLKAYNHPMGSLTAEMINTGAHTIAAKLALLGQGNHLTLDGSYYLEPVDSNNFDFDLNIRPLTLKSMEGLSFGSIKNSSGSLSGMLNIKGTTDQPVITGKLTTDQLATTVSMLNAYFKLPAETIDFSRHKIVFNKVHIEDSRGHTATLDGTAYTRNYTNYYLNLNFLADHWQAVHSQKKDNPEYYGDLVFSSDLSVKGVATAPKVEGNIEIHDSTDLHYALLDNGPGMVASEGIVQFVDSRDTFFTDLDTVQKPERRFRFSPSSQINVNVDVDKNATFTVLVDPATGDELQIKGEAALNAYMDPSGIIGLTGTYQVNKGYYELNYNFLHRKFDIQDGSTVTLSGDPLDAEADITAVYNTQVAPYDLVEDIAPTDQLVYYKQRLPFQVVLKIKGKVMKPEISFDIVLPDDKTNVVSTNVSNLVQAKLVEIRNNPSELNKQVFAVLILNKFLANNPFSSAGSMDMEHMARKSVSRFLSDQLNQIAGHLIKGLELNFDLNSTEDYSTGQKSNQTNLNVSASKTLFNDRLKVTVGNNFLLEGQSAQKQQSSLIPGNLALSYLLTKDGRYQASAYRTNEMESIINGYVVETGLKFKVTLTYNKFKYLFVNRKKYFRELRARRQAARKEESAEKDSTTNKEKNEQ
ncbi:MAG TPA: translocation/assembly module TamB domain-containing protein [Edaphocola sp.]|nr:translocation/assembly module TamB domain-containing protein [Edaphocola sp.]